MGIPLFSKGHIKGQGHIKGKPHIKGKHHVKAHTHVKGQTPNKLHSAYTKRTLSPYQSSPQRYTLCASVSVCLSVCLVRLSLCASLSVCVLILFIPFNYTAHNFLPI